MKKKILKPILLGTIGVLALAGCQPKDKPNNDYKNTVKETENKEKEPKEEVKETPKDNEEEVKDNPAEEKAPEIIADKYVMVDSVLYKDTGKINTEMTCGTMDGKILTSVDESEMPDNDDESNFGTGYEYQIGEKDITVEIDDKCYIFEKVGEKRLEGAEEYEKLAESTVPDFEGLEGEFKIKEARVYKVTEGDNKLTLLTNFAEMHYNYADGLFERASGILLPLKLEYEKDGEEWKLVSQIEAEDGERYFDSLVKMADGDEKLARRITKGHANERFHEWMLKLAEAAKEKGITDFEADLDNIPGYPKETSLFMDETPDDENGYIKIVNKEEYEELQKNDEPGYNTIEGLMYDKPTKILMKMRVEAPKKDNN